MTSTPTVEQEIITLANDLSQRVTAITGISQSLIYSRLKPMPVVRARWAIWYVLRALRCWPSTIIGAHFAVNHVTILHGVKQAEKLLRSDISFQSLISNLNTQNTPQ